MDSLLEIHWFQGLDFLPNKTVIMNKRNVIIFNHYFYKMNPITFKKITFLI